MATAAKMRLPASIGYDVSPNIAAARYVSHVLINKPPRKPVATRCGVDTKGKNRLQIESPSRKTRIKYRKASIQVNRHGP